MKQKTINKTISDINAISESGKTVGEYFTGSCKSNFFNHLKLMKEIENKSPEILKALEVYKIIVERSHTEAPTKRSSSSHSTKGIDGERTNVEFIRDDDNKIVNYKFTVYVQDRPPFTGTLSREEMNMIYRMYSYYGSSLTQKDISRVFPTYSLIDFKRILRAFSITKASAPFAPHMIEECTQQELLDIQFREKENDFLRNYENERVRYSEKALKEKTIEVIKLKEQLKKIPNLLKDIDLSGISFTPRSASFREDEESEYKSSLIIWLSDMHIGAAVSPNADYDNQYNLKVVESRLNTILSQCRDLCPTEIIVCDLGDAVDGMDNQTCRRDHMLPQNMDNKEQFTGFINVMLKFFTNIRDTFDTLENPIKYYSVGDSNHGGTFEYAAKYALCEILKATGVEAQVASTFFSHFEVDDHTFVITHGKDSRDMKTGLPLTLNDKTVNLLTSYLIKEELFNKDITIVKGDLHQSAVSYCNQFKYKSVGSLFGSSEWCQKNFGPTDASCDYSLIMGTSILDGRVNVQ